MSRSTWDGNTLVYVKGKGIVLNEPSVVAVDKATKRVLAVGRGRQGDAGAHSDRIEAVRPLKDGVIADFEKTEELLRKLILKVQSHRFLVRPRIIISVPPESPRWRSVRSATRPSTPGRARSSWWPSRLRAAIGVGLAGGTSRPATWSSTSAAAPRKSRSSPQWHRHRHVDPGRRRQDG